MKKLDVKNIIKYVAMSGYLLSSSQLLGTVDVIQKNKNALDQAVLRRDVETIVRLIELMPVFEREIIHLDEQLKEAVKRLLMLGRQKREATGEQFMLDRGLREAVESGNLPGVRKLLQQGANPNARDDGSGDTPLFLAVRKNDPASIGILFDGGAVWNNANWPMINCAAEAGSVGVVRMLVEMGHDGRSLDGCNQAAKDKAIMGQNRYRRQLDDEVRKLESKSRPVAWLPHIKVDQAKWQRKMDKIRAEQQMKVDQIKARIDGYEEIIRLLS
ncbi:MAG: ankyrin repeat domain-containing protein [Puniceicoccales bacterium]|jgi:hypothetical protein|nr:ankyrin repeat domain-containing protein [Puniceicoccales bacterium]